MTTPTTRTIPIPCIANDAGPDPYAAGYAAGQAAERARWGRVDALRDRLAELRRGGWSAALPRRVRTAADLDAAAVARMPCAACGRAGCDLWARYHPGRRHLIEIMVCPHCRAWSEV